MQNDYHRCGRVLYEHCQHFSLGIKPIPDIESSDSALPQREQADSTQNQTQQGVEALEKSYNHTPEITPEVTEEEVKPMGRLSRLEKALASEAA